MALFGSPLSTLMDQRLQWLSKRAELISSNLASSGLPNSVRKDLLDFATIVKRHAAQNVDPKPADMHVDPLVIKEEDVTKTQTDIAHDLETLEMSQNALEHEFMVNIMKQFHKLVRVASTRVQQ